MRTSPSARAGGEAVTRVTVTKVGAGYSPRAGGARDFPKAYAGKNWKVTKVLADF